jgi:hypothetical protein
MYHRLERLGPNCIKVDLAVCGLVYRTYQSSARPEVHDTMREPGPRFS